MSMKERGVIKQILIHLTEKDHKEFRVACKMTGRTMVHVLKTFILGFIESQPEEDFKVWLAREDTNERIASVLGDGNGAKTLEHGEDKTVITTST